MPECQWLTLYFLVGEAQMGNRLSLCLKRRCFSILCIACTGVKISTVKMPPSSSRNDGSRYGQDGNICLLMGKPYIHLLVLEANSTSRGPRICIGREYFQLCQSQDVELLIVSQSNSHSQKRATLQFVSCKSSKHLKVETKDLGRSRSRLRAQVITVLRLL